MSTSSIHAFSEKVALITDASNPYGRAVALQLALLGAYVIAGQRRAEGTDDSALRELISLGTLAKAFPCDAASAKGAKDLVNVVEETFGRLDLLVNCLKFDSESNFLEIGDENWFDGPDSILRSTSFITRNAFELMKDRPKPSIVNFAFNGSDPESIAVEHGIVGLTEGFAKELPRNFRVNCLKISDLKQEKNDSGLMLRPVGGLSPDDAARAAVYLLSSEAKSINGQTICVS